MKWLTCVLAFAFAPACMGQWEMGVLGGYGFPREVDVNSRSGVSGKTGFKHGAAFGVMAGDDMHNYLGGEVRYLYRMGDMKLKTPGADVQFDAQSHLIHFDLLFYARPKRERVRPFIAVGGGARIFQGTGVESSYQPGSSLVVLTHTRETTPLASVGAGVKVRATGRISFRVEMRDYISPLPTKLIAPMGGSTVGSWMHDIVPMVGLGVTF